MTEEELWKNFCDRNGVTSDTPHMTWKFGETPDYLVALVMEKIKTATASAYELYAIDEPEGMPKVGDYSVILNARRRRRPQPCILEKDTLEFLYQ